VLFLECGGLDCCIFAKGGGSGRLKGGVAPGPNLVLKKLGGLLRPMVLIGLDPALQGCGYRGSLTPPGLGFLQRQ
jgi:hypothetical protein